MQKPVRSGYACTIVAVLLALALQGCASRPTDPEDLKYYQEANDPLEPFNRAMFKFNDVADRVVLRPLAIGYKNVVPRGARTAVRNFLNNIREPFFLIHDILQGEGERAGHSAGRFITNTFVGFGGFIDVAGAAGVPYHEEDAGQTLAVWGVESGPYIVLPIFGPSTFRDALGDVVDAAIDPSALYIRDEYGIEGSATRFVIDNVDWRADNLELIDDLRKSSLDFYAATRSAYRQQRARQILNGREAAARGGSDPSMIKFDEFDSLDQPEGDDSEAPRPAPAE